MGSVLMQGLRWQALWLGLGGVMVGGVVYGSLMPDPPQPVAWVFADKLWHALAFAWLALWFLQVLAARAAVVAGLLLLGLAIEFTQTFTPDRHFEVADLAADAVGVVWGMALARTAAGQMLVVMERFLLSFRIPGTSS